MCAPHFRLYVRTSPCCVCVCIFVCLGAFWWYSCVCVCVCVYGMFMCARMHAPQVKAQDFPPCLEWPSLSDDDDSQDMDVSFVRLPFALSPFHSTSLSLYLPFALSPFRFITLSLYPPFARSPFRSISLSTPLPALGASPLSFRIFFLSPTIFLFPYVLQLQLFAPCLFLARALCTYRFRAVLHPLSTSRSLS